MFVLFREREGIESAREHLLKAKELNPADHQIYVCYGVIESMENNLHSALEMFQTAFIYFQQDMLLNKMIFFTFSKLGKLGDAVQFLERIYPAFKQIFWINRILGVHFSNMGDYRRATPYCQRALELFQFEKSKNYRLYYEKTSRLNPSMALEVPHMIDN